MTEEYITEKLLFQEETKKDKEISPNSILYNNSKTLSCEIQTRNDVQDKTFLILLNKNWVKDVSSHRKISVYYHVLW